MCLRIIADDGGAAPSIDRALVDLVQSGLLDGVALFSNFAPIASYRVLAGSTEIGIHLDVSSGAPVSESPQEIATLVNPSTGRFRSPLDFGTDEPWRLLDQFAVVVQEEFDPWHLRKEFEAQICRFNEQIGRRPDFVSVHHDLDRYAVVREAAEFASGMPTRQSRLADGTLAGYAYELYQPDVTEEYVAERTLTLVREMPTGGDIELIFHPAVDESGIGDFSVYITQRVVEYRTLCRPNFLADLHQARADM